MVLSKKKVEGVVTYARLDFIEGFFDAQQVAGYVQGEKVGIIIEMDAPLQPWHAGEWSSVTVHPSKKEGDATFHDKLAK
eukprot:5183236-Karenia_brevis.AAC.1